MFIGRRRFLQLSAIGIATVAVAPGCSPGRALDHPQLLSMLGDARVRQLGMKYRALAPAESSGEALRAALSAEPSTHSAFFRSSSIDDAVHEDFVTGRTVLVDGWVLSVTEARQAALFSLTPA